MLPPRPRREPGRLRVRGGADAVYEAVAAERSDEEVVALTLAIVAINGWNRFAVGFRASVGDYTRAGAAPSPR